MNTPQTTDNTKIGLITFHRPINFGAALQSVALATAIGSLGADCEIIDYVNPAFEKDYRPFTLSGCRSVKTLLWRLAMLPTRLRQRRGFRKFIKENAHLSKKCRREELASLSYDRYVTGSDQVFNYKCSGNDPSYFLDFVKGKPRFSYAASFGDIDVPAQYVEEYCRNLKDFTALSAREDSGVEFIKTVVGKDAVRSLDPTLLLSREQWGALASRTPRLIADDYVLIYFMAETETIRKHMLALAKRIRERYGYSIVIIGGSLHKKVGDIFHHNAASPAEFLALFRDASFVITNSFHGTAFSVNFRKDFYAYVRPDISVVGRVESLLSAFHLQDRIFSDADSVAELQSIDYTEKEAYISDEISKSYNYLREVVGS